MTEQELLEIEEWCRQWCYYADREYGDKGRRRYDVQENTERLVAEVHRPRQENGLLIDRIVALAEFVGHHCESCDGSAPECRSSTPTPLERAAKINPPPPPAPLPSPPQQPD